MQGWLRLAGLLLLQLAAVTEAVKTKISQKTTDRQICSGMYSKKGWGGSKDPYIEVDIEKVDNLAEGEDPIISLVIFEWTDEELVGKPVETDQTDAFERPLFSRVYLCTPEEVDAKRCSKDKIGAFILADDAESASKSQIVSEAIHLRDPQSINYEVKHTGYYCVITAAYSDDKHGEVEEYKGVAEFRNAFGQLAAAQIAKLPFYAVITLVYAFLGIGWGVLYYMNRHDILPVQNYITAILVFLVFEMFMTWLFYDYQNRHGLNVGGKALLIIVSILSAARNSFSFFLLLIVCMGYGVVKPTLGKAMIFARWLAIVHFLLGVVYAMASLSITIENAGPIVLLIVLPLAGTMTAFYIGILTSLTNTIKSLRERKQTVKASMYQKLWYCILASVFVVFAFFFVNGWIFAGQNQEDFVPNHWKARWFIIDGWLNLVYFFDVAFIAYVWRPTENNRRFAMSDEIAQDDDGFEIASLRDSLDGDELEDGKAAAPSHGGAPSDAPPAYTMGTSSSTNRDASPLPAPVPQKPTPLPRESLEGETMFALGEEDEGSGSESEGEGRRMMGGKKGD